MFVVTLTLQGCVPAYERNPPTGDTDPVVLTEQSIGPDGGVFEFGAVTMDFPVGALTEEVSIRIVELDRDPPPPYEGLSKVWAFEPHGLQFEVPVEVSIPFGPQDAFEPRIYWSGDDVTFTPLPDPVVGDGVVSAFTEHFSTGFVAATTVEVVETDAPYPPADILFVIDNSCTMFEEQTAISNAAATALAPLVGGGIDYHIGVTSTDMDDPQQQGRLRPLDGDRYISPATPDPQAAFSQMALMGTAGSFEEKGRAAGYSAIEIQTQTNQGFYRPDATFMTIYLSDEEDQSGSTPVTRLEYRDWLETLKPRPEDVIVHGFFFVPGTACPTADTQGAEYQRYTDWTGGVAASICQSDLTPDLESMLAWLDDTARVQIPEDPMDPPDVYLAGTLLVPGDYTWDAATLTVYFDQGVRPGPGETVRVEYFPAP